ncbi:MAG: zinc ribbon domain-containing protein [Planctomycetes bacterium]|nr:zinc ribbon domain-containing protein [Planctomycetota bacterium]
MPTYEYECAKCGHAMEAFQSMSAKPLKTCPKCSKNSLQRLLGAGGGLIFKGSGFYITDYRSSDYKSKASAETPSAGTKPEAKSEVKSDKKSETKSETPCAAGKTTSDCACAASKKSGSRKARAS